jgi:ADP-ribosylglycohydrolase
MGKCIGGTLGAPFECKRGVFDVDFYTQDLTKGPIPNDDLDLQLVWLNAVEKYGRNLNASILGEYWLTFIIQNWSEYGTGKNNLHMGLVPPLSGYVDNPNMDSCGCFIRSEIWACLAPGHPEIAVRYAYEDGCVDHSHEGLYGEIFFAALQSAAFIMSDKYELINIGLSYIPEDSAVAKAVRTAMESYESGIDWKSARKRILQEYPGSFGALGTEKENMEPDIPVGRIGWDAPSNIGLTIMAWIYGGEDFGESLCIAVRCGEDADCTAGTLGSILGIVNGIDSLPEKWTKPIGDGIATLCINSKEHGSRMSLTVPETVTELTDRILRLTPSFLGRKWCDILNPEGYSVETMKTKDLKYKPEDISYWEQDPFQEKLQKGLFTVEYDFVIYKARLDYTEAPFIQAAGEKKLILTLENNSCQQQWLEIKWHLPEGWQVTPGKKTSISLSHRMIGKSIIEFNLKLPEVLDESRYDLIMEITSQGRHTKGLLPVLLIHGNEVSN